MDEHGLSTMTATERPCKPAKLLQSCRTLQPHGLWAPGSSSMNLPRQEHWSGLPCTPPGDLLDPGIEPMSPAPPALAGRFFTSSTTREAWAYYVRESENESPSVTSDSLPPMDCSLPGSSVQGILQARILEWAAVPFSRGSSGCRK